MRDLLVPAHYEVYISSQNSSPFRVVISSFTRSAVNVAGGEGESHRHMVNAFRTRFINAGGAKSSRGCDNQMRCNAGSSGRTVS